MSAPVSRLLTVSAAAEYCNLSPKAFQRTCPVRPIALGEDARLLRYDRRALDRWIDGLSGVAVADDEDDEIFLGKAGHAARAR